MLAWYKKSVRMYLYWIASCIMGIMLLGVYNNYQNYREFGHPIYPSDKLSDQSNATPADTSFRLDKWLSNSVRYSYDAIDFRGAPELLSAGFNKAKKTFAEQFLNNDLITKKYIISPFSFDTPLVYFDTIGWFGILGFVLIAPVTVWGISTLCAGFIWMKKVPMLLLRRFFSYFFVFSNPILLIKAVTSCFRSRLPLL